ncbi:conserved hypothetical protein [Streptomyces viridochromogenes DSM 40736]|uniref:Uncharacterized protein n=1 Tax=Streptomyces viridochromogenes (strain DSM 40736 / JCM 4977 / BCRC 1201 / Tue 494) TaxID=591159 RepID=D9X6V1_STRVT|nr:conserved hypothetical protein [Streptomyces viridochromogenes DSM 40736]
MVERIGVLEARGDPAGHDVRVADLPADAQNQDEVVILVHGTFAGDKDGNDSGSRWWQRGSDTWRWLERNLPAGTSLPQNGRLFHWSGANTQSARLLASMDLLAFLLELERKGRGYHLVGHSHGGSVIWEALLTCHILQRKGGLVDHLYYSLVRRGVLAPEGHDLAAGNRQLLVDKYQELGQELKLNHLRSWTTIGTPFLCHLPEGGWFSRGWRHAAFSLAGSVSAKDAKAPSWTVWFVATVFAVSVMLGLGLALFGSVGPMWILVWLASSVTALKITISIVVRSEVAHAVTTRAKAAPSAFAHFSARWLGLYATTDEAITGLRTLCPPQALDYSQLRLPPAQRSIPQKVTAAWPEIPTLLRLNAPLRHVALAPEASFGYGYYYSGSTLTDKVYDGVNGWIMPKINRLLAGRLRRTAQGCDIPYVDLVYVSPWPVPIDAGVTGLPDRVDTSLEEGAASHAGLLGIEVRQLIARAAMNGTRLSAVLADHQLDAAGKSMVHTSYLTHPEILHMIRRHIADSCRSSQVDTTRAGLPSDSREWMVKARAHAAGRAALHSPEVL